MYKLDIQGFADGSCAPEAACVGAQGAGEDSAGTAPEEAASRKAAYDEFIREHKAEDEARLSALFKKRFRADKSASNRLSALEGAFSGAMARRGAKSLEHLADMLSHGEEGPSPGDIQKGVTAQVDAWMAEAEALKAEGAFDLKKELSDKAFTDALRETGSLRSAYRLSHFDEIVASERDKARAAVTESIRARGGRASELGARAMGALPSVDVSRLTDEQLADISRRSRRGETIRF